MAKKKTPALTLEEALKQALVPNEEQPYSVPENWCWVSIGAINQYSSRSVDPAKSPDTIYELYSVPSSAENYPEIISGREIGSSKQSVSKNDVLLCKINPRINRVWKVSQHTNNPLLASSEWIIVRNSKLNPDYLMWCFRNKYFREYMLSNVSGVGGSLMRAQPKYVQTYPIPLPPLPEQHRIVARIESLFAKLDEAKEKLRAVVDSFETRKAAILHKAFSGELTEQWRKEHGVGMESWKQCIIGDVFDLQAGKSISAKNISSQKTDQFCYPCFGGNGVRGYVDRFNREGEHPIIGRQGALCGNINLANNQFYVTEHAVVVSYKMKVATSWAYHYLKFLNLNQYATATAQPGLAVSNIIKVPIQYASFEEQQEISKILDDLLNKDQQAQKSAEATLAQIDLIKKSILARAFRGELGTNDPGEKSAKEILREVVM